MPSRIPRGANNCNLLGSPFLPNHNLYTTPSLTINLNHWLHNTLVVSLVNCNVSIQGCSLFCKRSFTNSPITGSLACASARLSPAKSLTTSVVISDFKVPLTWTEPTLRKSGLLCIRSATIDLTTFRTGGSSSIDFMTVSSVSSCNDCTVYNYVEYDLT